MTATTTRPSARRGAVAAALVVTSLLVAGCSSAPPAPAPDPSASGPVLTLDQNSKVLDAMNAALTAASAAHDPAQLAGRVTGPALAVRTSQLQVAAVRGSDDFVTVLPSTYQQIILPTTTTWPRTSFAITNPTDQMQPQRLLALVQESPRDPFKLWGWVQLRPGIRMPAFADAKLGSEVLAPDDASLKVTPQDVINQYADVITTGDGSAFVGTFEPSTDDPFRVLLKSVAATQSAALAAPAVQGTYTFSVTPLPNTPVQAVRTADGGAVVMASLAGTEVFDAPAGAKITPGTGTAQTLLQGQTPSNKLTSGYTDMVALYVPPAGSDQPVILVGYSHVQTSAAFG